MKWALKSMKSIMTWLRDLVSVCLAGLSQVLINQSLVIWSQEKSSVNVRKEDSCMLSLSALGFVCFHAARKASVLGGHIHNDQHDLILVFIGILIERNR